MIHILSKRIGSYFSAVFFAFIFLLATNVVSANDAFSLTDAEKSYLQSVKNREITFGYTSEVMMTELHGGEYYGVLSPLRTLLTEDFGLNVNFRKYAWTDAMNGLPDNSPDIFGMLALSPARVENFYSTNELYSADIEVITRLSHPLSSLVYLDGKKIGLLENSALPQILNMYMNTGGELSYFPSVDEQLLALAKGEIDVVISSQSLQMEVLRNPLITHEFYIDATPVSHGLISGNEDIKPLFDIINRYYDSPLGALAVKEQQNQKLDAIMEATKKLYKNEIQYIKENYDTVRMINPQILYPLVYKQDGAYKGLQSMVNNTFEQLTGVLINQTSTEENDGYFASKRLVTDGGAEMLGGSYAVSPDDCYSLPVINDRICLYAPVEKEYSAEDVGSLKIGITPDAFSLIDWRPLLGSEPTVYFSRFELLNAVKSGQVDAIILSEMAFNYEYTIKRDFSLHKVGDINIETPLYLIYNEANAELNKLMDASVDINKILYPNAFFNILRESQNDKFDLLRHQAGWQNNAKMFIIIICCLLAALIILLTFVWRQKKRLSEFDKEFSDLISSLEGVDIIWGDLETGIIQSKSDLSMFKKWVEMPDDTDKIEAVSNFTGNDLGALMKEALDKIYENNLRFTVVEEEILNPDGKRFYARHFVCRLSDVRFMMCTLDVTEEKAREMKLNRLASTDSLSGLLTRRAINDLLLKKTAELSRTGKQAYIAMFDIDDFKLVNDMYGHDVGDIILVKVSNLIRTTEGFEHSTSRWGGEEFLSVFDAENRENAEEKIQTILTKVSNDTLEIYKRSITTTVSAGISSFDAEKDFKTAISESDSALYAAKQAGKNRLDFYDDSMH